MLSKSVVEKLKKSKNLLAFSGGGDSTALFFLLLEHHIPFDIAIVDYGVREQSKKEVRYAKELASKYNKKCFVETAPEIRKNFEATARKIRYTFFEKLIEKHRYDTLLTAHHLGDRLEWFLMQLCKGSGCLELAGMRIYEKREGYKLVRPLLQQSKEELTNYLQSHNIRYFHDTTNDDESFMRNRFRHNFAEPLLQKYKEGIRRSFTYMDEDRDLLLEKCEFFQEGELSCFYKTASHRSTLHCIDTELKKRGFVLSTFEKEQLKKAQNMIVGRKYLIVFHDKVVCISPYSDTKTTLPKKFKEECRKLKIEPKLRPFFHSHPKAFLLFKKLLESFN